MPRTARTSSRPGRGWVYSLIRVRPFDSPQPLDQAFQFLVRQLCPPLSHVERGDSPLIRAIPRLIHAVQAMTSRACATEKRLGFRVTEEGRDLRGNVRAREWPGILAEFCHHPVEEQ